MNGPEAAALFVTLVTLTVAVVLGLDWWGRRQDRRARAARRASHRPQ